MIECQCAPTYDEYWDGMCLILQQNLPVVRQLVDVIFNYAKTEDPLQIIAKMCPPCNHSSGIVLANIRGKIMTRSSKLYVTIWNCLDTAASMLAYYYDIPGEPVHISIYIGRNHKKSTIHDAIDSCACRTRVRIGMFVTMPFECKCEGREF